MTSQAHHPQPLDRFICTLDIYESQLLPSEPRDATCCIMPTTCYTKLELVPDHGRLLTTLAIVDMPRQNFSAAKLQYFWSHPINIVNVHCSVAYEK